MKPISITIILILLAFLSFGQTPERQRNTIYVLDCTGSMGGYNGTPDIWEPTKNFLKNELEKEASSNPNARVTILPFQD